VSPTYLYCLTTPTAPDPPAGTAGLDGGEVRRLGDAWVSDVSSRSVQATVERIRAHDAVVTAALGTGSTPVPARFGQTFADDNECVAAISAKKETMSAGLARVAGMVEMTVLLRTNATVDSSSGTAYLQSLARRDHTLDELRGLNARFADVVRESAERAGQDTVTLSHLVEREALAMYIERARMLTSGLDARIIGPAAPYSFGPPA
jgi:hypothetical protein